MRITVYVIGQFLYVIIICNAIVVIDIDLHNKVNSCKNNKNNIKITMNNILWI